MADETPPLDDARLETIRRRIDVLIPGQVMTEYDITMLSLLSAEVDRLRAKEAAAMAIMSELIDGVPQWETINSLPAPYNKMWRCHYCGVTKPKGEAFVHASDCPVTKARALLAQE